MNGENTENGQNNFEITETRQIFYGDYVHDTGRCGSTNMSWKTFKFFEYEEVKDPETNEPLNKLKVNSI